MVKSLIAILYDATASEAEKDDAIIDLSDYDDAFVEESLFRASQNLQLSEMLQSSIGETLATIWIRKNHIDFNKFNLLSSVARKEAKNCIKKLKPTLLNEYEE